MKFILSLLFVSCLTHSKSTESDKHVFFKKIFPQTKIFEEVKIDDPISDQPVNTKLYIAKDSKGKLLGFIRDIVTSTGCGGPCLPVVFTLFYDKDKKLIDLLSKKKLTKKNHAPFKFEDYFKLKGILDMNPASFKSIKHPTEMVDAITGATLKVYKNEVVEKAAYTTLRVNTYNQHTLKFLSSFEPNFKIQK